MQIDPVRPKLKPPGTKRLKLNCDILLSTSAFKFSLRRYTEVFADNLEGVAAIHSTLLDAFVDHTRLPVVVSLGQSVFPAGCLHSSIFQLNLSRFRH